MEDKAMSRSLTFCSSFWSSNPVISLFSSSPLQWTHVFLRLRLKFGQVQELRLLCQSLCSVKGTSWRQFCSSYVLFWPDDEWFPCSSSYSIKKRESFFWHNLEKHPKTECLKAQTEHCQIRYERRLALWKYIHAHKSWQVSKFCTFSTCCYVR